MADEKVRCWECGQFFAADQIHRMDVYANSVWGFSLFSRSNAAHHFVQSSRVDMCFPCAQKLYEQRRQNLRSTAIRLGIGFGILIAVVFVYGILSAILK